MSTITLTLPARDVAAGDELDLTGIGFGVVKVTRSCEWDSMLWNLAGRNADDFAAGLLLKSDIMLTVRREDPDADLKSVIDEAYRKATSADEILAIIRAAGWTLTKAVGA